MKLVYQSWDLSVILISEWLQCLKLCCHECSSVRETDIFVSGCFLSFPFSTQYCCPDMVDHFFLEVTKTECLSTPNQVADFEKGKLIMLVKDFYYGKHEGDTQQVQQEQKTHTTFKCFSCLKVLKNNIRYLK